MKRFLYFGILLFGISCSNDDGPPPIPEGASLVFPIKNSECTTSISLNDKLSQVTFEWLPAKNADLYTLTVINLSSNSPQAITTAATSVALSIEKSTPFSWSVLTSNTASDITAISENWLFYNAGFQTTYAPFPAQLLEPKSGETVLKNTANEIVLKWSGADVEDDIMQYEVFFSEQNPPVNVLLSTDNEVQATNVSVLSGTTYYWKVRTTDSEGNRSDSVVFDFRVL